MDAIPVVIFMVVAFVTYVVAEIMKALPAVNNKFVPLINLAVGLVSGGIIIGFNLVPELHVAYAMALAVVVSLGTAGFYDILKKLKGE